MASMRKIIKIDDDLCNGCGKCAVGCPEGAIQMIDGKARLVSEIFCDGLGACIGDCPVDAITVEEREAQAYSEWKTMDNIVVKGANTIKAHLKHLLHHGETTYYKQALEYLKEKNIPVPVLIEPGESFGSCPSMQERTMKKDNKNTVVNNVPTELTTWPVQLKLVSPFAGYFKNADILIAADCTAFSYGNFHSRFMKDKVTLIMCPKLDNANDNYVDKLTEIFKNNDIKSITIVRMEVPCCGGTTKLIEESLKNSGKNIILREYVVGIDGEIK
ncbi:MAG: 4Fe-4S binding protein [Spirochaetota bacterium]